MLVARRPFSPTSVSLLALTLALGGSLAACSSEPDAGTGGSGGAGAGGSGHGAAGPGGSSVGGSSAGGSAAGGSSAGGSAAGGSGGSASDCPQADSMLDVSQAPGAGASYPKPTLSAMCTDTRFVVESNDIPHYTFVQTTPNPLAGHNEHWEIPRNPQVAAQTSKIPLLGVVGFAVNGLPFFGPNEAAQPANEAYGDPVYNGLMDPCLGHTSPGEYHYHSMLVKCLNDTSLVAKPWQNADPPANEESPIIAWSLDGFPVLGPQECADAGCSSIVTLKSGYAQTGNPKTNAWDAYTWSAHPNDATYLDECNGHTGPGGDYHYHATETFPYILGCYRGTPAAQ